jgi:S-adenosylmethionine/arginine decarboxylase-like enzyme
MRIEKMKKAAIACCALLCTFGFSTETQQEKHCDYWGYHLILDCKSCDKEKFQDPEYIKTFIKTLVEEIDMKAYGEPILEHFATHNPLAGGYSLVQLIETSDITAHFVDLNGDAYFDIFSCKPFDILTAEHVIQDFFNPQSIKKIYLERQA